MNASQKTDMFKIINSFVDELDISFDLECISDIRQFIALIDHDETTLQRFIDENEQYLKKYDTNFSNSVLTKQKKCDFTFMNEIHLFNNILSLSVFSTENKNTKRSILKHVYNLCVFSSIFNNRDTISQLPARDNHVTKEQIVEPIVEHFIDPLPQPSAQPFDLSSLTGLLGGSTSSENPSAPLDLSSLAGLLGGNQSSENSPNLNLANLNLGDMMGDLMKNTDIMGIAREITTEMQDNINPADLLSSIMSGNLTDGPIAGLMSKIQSSVDSKIQSGDIDPTVLENQAKEIMSKMNLDID